MGLILVEKGHIRGMLHPECRNHGVHGEREEMETERGGLLTEVVEEAEVVEGVDPVGESLTLTILCCCYYIASEYVFISYYKMFSQSMTATNSVCSDGGFNRSGEGFSRSRGADNQTGGEQGDVGGGPQIGTWTNEAEANPKTDSWGEMWSEEDNQWQGMSVCLYIPVRFVCIVLLIVFKKLVYTRVMS